MNTSTKPGQVQATVTIASLLVTFFLGFASPVRADLPELFFSEYVEGSSYNKALEIYNGTGLLVNLAAGNYTIEIYFDGNTSPGTTIALTGTVAAGDVYVVADDGAATAILAETDQTSTANFFNGDDAVVLLRNGAIIDVIGQIGFYPDSEWGSGNTSTQDNTLRRKETVEAGDANGGDAFDPSIEWDGYPQDTFDGLGSHSIILPPSDPLINEFVFNHTGSDTNEYVEVFGDPSADYSSFTVLEIEGDDSDAGVIDGVFPVGTTNAGGFWTTGFLNDEIENGTVTLLLVEGFTGSAGDDLDADNDSILDTMPWTRIVDDVAVDDGDVGDGFYSSVALGPSFDGLSPYPPGGASRIPNGTDTDAVGDWARNDFDGAGLPGFSGSLDVGEALNTPEAVNELIPTLPPDVIINEVDCDTPDTDMLEFVELYDSGVGNTAMDGLVVVFYDGDGDASYNAFDLDGFFTDANGYFLLGNSGVTPIPSIIFDSDGLQNGADAVALYSGDAADFPNGTAVTTVNLIDAIVYDTNDSDDAGLLVLLNADQPQVNEDAAGDKDNHSNQRCPNGEGGARNTDTYTQNTPTPGAENACGVGFGVCGDPATLIHDVQGSGDVSPLDGTPDAVIEGVVVGDFQDTATELGGFFLQEEDADADADPMTSEGVFVYDNGFGVDVSVGDVVRVQGSVTEYYDLTELDSVSNAVVCSSGVSATAAMITLPIADLAEWEWYEGMLVTISQTLYATGNYNQGRYGEVDLSVGDRLDTPTNVATPGAAANALQDLNDRSRVLLDDGSTVQNPLPLPPYIGVGDTLRAGDTIPDLTGVLAYGFGAYRIHPTEPVDFTRVNTRDASSPPVGGTLKVASFNVLNYFNGDGLGGGFPTPRGADTPEEFTRQRDKIISAILAMDAGVIGLMELENDGYGANSAIQDLVNGLNDVAGAGAYAFVNPGVAQIGTDEIAVGFIYKPGTVTPVGSAAILDSSVDPLFNDDKNRPALAQTFEQNATGETFTVVVNHLKSKGSPCDDVGDPDVGDGQGNCNVTRTNAANALTAWLATDPTSSSDSDFLIIGDLNAYAMEDPITAIKNAGYTNLIESFIGADAYSYVFYGQAGYLDHALASASLASQVTGVTEWHINADEPAALDYNDYNQPDLYNPDAYRSSDHDPTVTFVNESTGDEPLYFLWDFGDGSTSTETSPTHSWAEPGLYTVTLTVSNVLGSDSASAEILVRPRTILFEAFKIHNATIDWHSGRGHFSVFGQLKLPEGYTHDNLTRDLELALTIGGESAADAVSMTEDGQMWSFRECPQYPVEGVQLTWAFIIWPRPDDPYLPVFILQGTLSLPGVDHRTRPAEATVTLSLPVAGDQLAEQVSGEKTILFQPHYHLWFYKLQH